MVQAAEVGEALLTIQEVAKRLSVSVRTVHTLLDRGHMASINVAVLTKRRRRIPRAEVERFLRERFVGKA